MHCLKTENLDFSTEQTIVVLKNFFSKHHTQSLEVFCSANNTDLYFPEQFPCHPVSYGYHHHRHHQSHCHCPSCPSLHQKCLRLQQTSDNIQTHVIVYTLFIDGVEQALWWTPLDHRKTRHMYEIFSHLTGSFGSRANKWFQSVYHGRPLLPWQRNLWNLAKNGLEVGLHKPKYKLSSDFSLEFWLHFRRLWPAILCSGRIR